MSEPIVLRPEHVKTLSQLDFIKQYLQAQLAAVDKQMASLLNIAYCVDVTEGDWNLDFDNGVLTHADNATNEP